MLDVNVVNNKIVIEIDARYLENSFEMGVTTNVCGKVSDKEGMLEYFASNFGQIEGDSAFNRCIDRLCEEAIDKGYDFVELDDEDY